MTFVPEALPIGFNSSVHVNVCFEISPEATAATSGNRQPRWPTQCWGHSLLASGRGKRRGWGWAMCVMRFWCLKALCLELSAFDR